MKRTFISAILAALLFSACSKTEDDVVTGSDENKNPIEAIGGGDGSEDATYICKGSPIRTFYEPDYLTVIFGSPSQGKNTLGFFMGMFAKSMEAPKVEYWSRGSEKYKEYVNYYGDTTYNRRHYIGDDYIVSAMPLAAINVTADKDFDAEHPAGSSLNDVLVLRYASAYNLLKSNYDYKLDITYNQNNYETVPLSEMESLSLPYHIAQLLFSKLPDNLGAYKFTISLEYGKDPVSGKEVKVEPVTIEAEFTEKDFVTI